MQHEKFCQSCSMPLDDESLLGTEKDGSLSKDYCEFCYQNGSFSNPSLTMQQMITRMKQRMTGTVPPDAAEAALNRLPQLKRWRND